MKKFLPFFLTGYFFLSLNSVFSQDEKQINLYETTPLSSILDKKMTSENIKMTMNNLQKKRVYSLEELCSIAKNKSPRIMAKIEVVNAASSNVFLKKIELLPGLSLTGSGSHSATTDSRNYGVQMSWSADLSKLLMRDVSLAKNGLISSKEMAWREEIWVLNSVEDLYRSISELKMRSSYYKNVISATETLVADIPGFDRLKTLKIEDYKTNLTSIEQSIKDQTSRLSALAFGDPYNGFIQIDPNYLRSENISIDRKAVLRESVKKRMRTDIYNLNRHDILIKLSTRGWQPRVTLSFSHREVDIIGQSYSDPNSDIVAVTFSLPLNPFASSASKARARANKRVAESNVIMGLNNLINSTYRALDEFEQADKNLREYIAIYGEEPVDFIEALRGSYGENLENIDRNVFEMLDLELKNALKLVSFYSKFKSAKIRLNNHVMRTPLNFIPYALLDPSNTMPEIFSKLDIPKSLYEKHVQNMISFK